MLKSAPSGRRTPYEFLIALDPLNDLGGTTLLQMCVLGVMMLRSEGSSAVTYAFVA